MIPDGVTERFMVGGVEQVRHHAGITRVLRFDPGNVGALYFEGALLAAQHRFREAAERWRRVIALDPTSTFARRARRDLRSASELQHILTLRAG